MFKVEITDKGLMTKLSAIAVRAEKIPQELWQSIGQKLIDSVKFRFQENMITPTSESARLRGQPTLVKSGALMNSGRISEMTPFSVQVSFGEGLPYAGIHQTGGVTHPTVTARAKRFYLAKFLQTKGTEEANMWLALMSNKKHPVGSKLNIAIQQRRYARVYDDAQDHIKDKLKNYILQGAV